MFTQVRVEFQNLKLEGWDIPTSMSTTIQNNGKTGKLKNTFLKRLFWHFVAAKQGMLIPHMQEEHTFFLCNNKTIQKSKIIDGESSGD